MVTGYWLLPGLTCVDGAPHEGPDDAWGRRGGHRLALHLHQLSHHAHLAEI